MFSSTTLPKTTRTGEFQPAPAGRGLSPAAMPGSAMTTALPKAAAKVEEPKQPNASGIFPESLSGCYRPVIETDLGSNDQQGDHAFDSSSTADSLRAGLTTRLTTENDGDLSNEQAHYPYGESWYESGQANPSVLRKYTSYLREDEASTGRLNYAVFREHSARIGRFHMADSVRGRVSNPQRLNRYAYVRNNPISRIDPKGLDDFDLANEAAARDLYIGSWFRAGDSTVSQATSDAPPQIGDDPIGSGIFPPGGAPCPFTDPFRCLWWDRIQNYVYYVSGNAGLPPGMASYGWLGYLGGPGNCTETVRGRPLFASWCKEGDIFLREWECEGDRECCREKRRGFIDWCSDVGKNNPRLEFTYTTGYSWIDTLHCCGRPRKP